MGSCSGIGAKTTHGGVGLQTIANGNHDAYAPRMVIDVHAHCIPSTFTKWLENRGDDFGARLVENRSRVSFADTYTTLPLRPDLTDRERRLAEMNRMGVDIQVLAGYIDLHGYHLPAAKGRVYAEAHNDCLAGEVASESERFRGLANVPLQDVDASIRELQRAMSDLGMVGVQIATRVGDRWLDQAGLDAFWEAAESLGALILLHPFNPLHEIDLTRWTMSNMIGRPAETTISLGGLVLDGVLERYPDLKLCVVHGGGFAPYQIGRLDRGHLALPESKRAILPRKPSEYLRQIFFDTVVHDPGVLRFLVDTVGPGQVLLGSDYPFPMGDPDPVTLVGSVADLKPADRLAILGDNLRRLLGESPTLSK